MRHISRTFADVDDDRRDAHDVFSSVNAIRKYTMEEIFSWIIIMPQNSYRWGLLDLDGAGVAGYGLCQAGRRRYDPPDAGTARHGIKLLGSSIVGLEHHTPENIRGEIEYAVAHATDFHQFMLYTPVPGTPLHSEMSQQKKLLDVDLADIHGQDKFNFQHAAISREDSKKFLDWAFFRDFERNGPSLFRICRTTLVGWKSYRNHPDQRIRERFNRTRWR